MSREQDSNCAREMLTYTANYVGVVSLRRDSVHGHHIASRVSLLQALRGFPQEVLP